MTGDGPPFIRIGRSIRYAEASLAHWVKGRQTLADATDERYMSATERGSTGV